MSNREQELLHIMKDDVNLSIYVDEDEDDLLTVIFKMDKHIRKMSKALKQVDYALKDVL